MKRTSVLLLGLGLAVSAVAGRSWMDERALMDSARLVPPKVRMEWMYQRGKMEDRGRRTEEGPAITDSGLVLRGKWGRGPAAEVTGKDTLVVLTLGSEVALLSFAEPDSPVVLSEIQFPSLTAQSYLVDSLLYTSSNADLEVWNVSDPAQPVKRGELLGAVGDFWIQDTFLYFIRSDTFHVLSIANPSNMYELGSCLESGSVTTGSGNTVVVVQNGGYAFVDVSNPASPHQVGTYACGRTQFFSAAARGNLVCASYEESGYPYPVRFITLDISTPSSPRLLAKLNNVGGYDIFLDGPLAFVSGRGPWVENPQPFQMLSIADSAHPAFIDSCRTTFDFPWAVWENAGLERAFAANRYGGLAVVDIHNLNNPVLDTAVLRTGSAVDVHVDGSLCYVAGETDGLRLLDVTDPTHPVFLSGLDTSLFTDASNYSVTARDSFAFVCWRNPYFRVVSMTDPLHPQMVAACGLFSQPEDMVLRDSLVYCANNYSLQIVNVAQPRAPVLVGTCALPNYSYDLCLQDTLAYVANGPALEIINVSKPASPSVVSAWPGHAYGLDLRDTIVYAAGSQVLNAISVADAAAPYLLDSLPLSFETYDVVVVDSVAYVCGCQLQTVNVADPRNLRVMGASFPPPSVYANHITHVPPYFYVACTDGGVGIYETSAVGITESSRERPRGSVSLRPNPARDLLLVSAGPGGCVATTRVFDTAGRIVLSKKGDSPCSSMEINVSRLPVGLYFVEVGSRNKSLGVCKFIRN